MSFLDPRQWLLAIAFIGAVVLGVKFWEHRLVQQGDQAGYARAVSQAQKAADKARADAETKTRQLQTDADQARKEKPMRSTNLIALAALWLSACASAPSAPPVVQGCPRLPALDPLPAGVLEPSFTARMESFLSGSLPGPMPSASSSRPATPPTSAPVASSTR